MLRNSRTKTPPRPSAAPVEERQRERRERIQMVGTVRTAAGRFPARICDISRHGFGARSVISFPIGSEIVVSLPLLGEVRAQVRWALGSLFGARFLDGVDAAALIAGSSRPDSPLS